jgi:phage protein D
MIPRAYLTISGVSVRPADIVSLTWESTLFLAADSLEVELNNREGLSDWVRKDQEIFLYLGYVKDASAWSQNELSFCFAGRIDAVKPKFGEDGETLTLMCRDYARSLIDTEYSVAYAERTASQIAEMLAKKYGLTPQVKTTTDILSRDLFQQATEWEVLQELAKREGYVCYVTKDKKLVFAPRTEDAEIVARYIWKKNVPRAEFDDSCVGVVNKVTVRHWTNKQKIEASAQDDFLIRQMGRVVERVFHDAQVKTAAQAQEKARKRLKELARPVVTGELTVVGDPVLSAEKRVILEGFGRFSGTYYIERATHRFGPDGYTTDLAVTNVRPEDAQQYRQDLYNYQAKTM